MKTEKNFFMKKSQKEFDEEILDYLIADCDCDKQTAEKELSEAFSDGWTLFQSPKTTICIQTDYDRVEVKIRTL